jgi:hypothetical protein
MIPYYEEFRSEELRQPWAFGRHVRTGPPQVYRHRRFSHQRNFHRNRKNRHDDDDLARLPASETRANDELCRRKSVMMFTASSEPSRPRGYTTTAPRILGRTNLVVVNVDTGSIELLRWCRRIVVVVDDDHDNDFIWIIARMRKVVVQNGGATGRSIICNALAGHHRAADTTTHAHHHNKNTTNRGV